MNKMMKWKIPLFKIYWDKEDIKSVTEVIKKGMMWTDGEKIREFEKMIAEYMGRRYCVCFNSGTSALHAVLQAYGVGEGDEVIVPSFTFISTCNAPLFVGAKPVFADIEEKTLGLSPEDVRQKISKNTKAVIPVHYGGMPCRIKEIKKIAEEFGLVLIEDAAEAFGAEIGGKKVGTFGDAAILSFCQNKIITTGEGGAVLTDSKRICEKLKLLRSHGRKEKRGYFFSPESGDYITLGYNFRMSEIAASLGISQFKKVKEIINKRRKIAQRFLEKLREIKEIETINPPEDFFCVYQMFPVIVDNRDKRDKLISYLAEKGIVTKVYFEPVHLTRFYKEELKYRCNLPVTEKISERILTLPLYPSMTEEEIDEVVNEIKNFFAEEKREDEKFRSWKFLQK